MPAPLWTYRCWFDGAARAGPLASCLPPAGQARGVQVHLLSALLPELGVHLARRAVAQRARAHRPGSSPPAADYIERDTACCLVEDKNAH